MAREREKASGEGGREVSKAEREKCVQLFHEIVFGGGGGVGCSLNIKFPLHPIHRLRFLQIR